MPTFLAKPLVKYGLPAVLAVVLILAFRWWLNDQKEDAAREAVTNERQEAGQIILNRVETAHEVRRQVADPASRARYDECVRSARKPENCKRLLPQ